MPSLTKEISEGNLGTIPFPLISWIVHIINGPVDTIKRKIQKHYPQLHDYKRGWIICSISN